MHRKLSIVLSFLVLALAIAPAAADALEVESAEGWLRDSAGAVATGWSAAGPTPRPRTRRRSS